MAPLAMTTEVATCTALLILVCHQLSGIQFNFHMYGAWRVFVYAGQSYSLKVYKISLLRFYGGNLLPLQ
jgi:hypothetical protein